MYRLTILIGRLYKSVPPTNYFFKVLLVGRFMPLVGGIGRPVESPLQTHLCRDTTINLKIVTALTLFYKDNCNSAPNPNILTILSALQTLEYDLFLEINTGF